MPSLIAIDRAALPYQLLDLNITRRGVPFVLRLAILSNCVPRDFFAFFVGILLLLRTTCEFVSAPNRCPPFIRSLDSPHRAGKARLGSWGRPLHAQRRALDTTRRHLTTRTDGPARMDPRRSTKNRRRPALGVLPDAGKTVLLATRLTIGLKKARSGVRLLNNLWGRWICLCRATPWTMMLRREPIR